MAGRRSLVASLTALLLGIGAASAAADTTTLRDDRRETKPLQRNGRLDIVAVAVRHRGELVKHAVKMRRRVHPRRGKERPLIGINTRGGARSNPEYLVFGNGIFERRRRGDPKRVGGARLRARGRRWIYLFDPDDIEPRLRGYGWAAISTKGRAFDVAPANRYEPHDLRR